MLNYAKLLKSAFQTSKAGIVDRENMIAMIDMLDVEWS